MAHKPLQGSIGRLPFKEQIEFFRRKVALPSESWTQLYGAGHDHGFVVSGATREALVTDFMKSVDEAIAGGKSLESFRRDFDGIVAGHGWDYNGSRNWRSRVIYETNLATSFAAGRRAQMVQMTDTHPYWMYVHSDAVKDPRPEHQAWHGMVLRWDDPFWKTHFPPNGWGCRCEVRALNARQLRAMGKTAPDAAPEIPIRTVTIGKNSSNPRVVKVPVGIDPGFEYAPGAASGTKSTGSDAWIERQAWQSLSEVDVTLAKNDWLPVLTSGPAQFGRVAQVKEFAPPASLAPLPKPGEPIAPLVAKAIGANRKTYDVHGLPVTVDAQALGAHIAQSDARRAVYLPLLPDLLENPWEVWTNVYRNRKTGNYELRSRFIKAYDLKGGRSLMVVAQAARGFFEGWTFFPTRNIDYINRQRIGKLWYGAPDVTQAAGK